MQNFFIVSVKWTRKSDTYISFWGPENTGYKWPLSWSGHYSEEEVNSLPDYYHNGESTIAVPVDIVQKLGVSPKPKTVDNDAGPVVLNTRENWETLKKGMVQRPLNRVRLYPLP